MSALDRLLSRILWSLREVCLALISTHIPKGKFIFPILSQKIGRNEVKPISRTALWQMREIKIPPQKGGGGGEGKGIKFHTQIWWIVSHNVSFLCFFIFYFLFLHIFRFPSLPSFTEIDSFIFYYSFIYCFIHLFIYQTVYLRMYLIATQVGLMQYT